MFTSLYPTAPSEETIHSATSSLSTDSESSQIIGDSIAMRRLHIQVRRLGPHFRTVLLRGEKGAGKELVARTLHSFSSHATGPFVAFNCASKSRLSVSVEMNALMKEAHRGTLYLIEVGEMAAKAQADLLEVMQGLERRRGPILVRGLEARIIASTSDDLRVLTASGRFHPVLYQKIANVEIELPTLQQRTEDIPLLAQHFLEKYALRYGLHPRGISEDALLLMQTYPWPDNVRELEALIEQAVVENGARRIEAEDISIPARPVPPAGAVTYPAKLQDVVEQHVFQVLKDCAGNKVKAAEMLGISRSTLYRMLEAGLQTDRVENMR